MKRVSFNGTVVLLRYVSLFPSFNPILPSFTEFSWIVANFSNLSRRLRTWTNSFLIFPNFTQNLSWCWRVWPTIMKCYLIILNLTYFTSLIWFSLPTLSETPDSFTRFSLHPFALAVEVFSYWWPQIWRCWIGPNDQHLFLPFGHGFFLRISNGAVVFAFFAVPGAGYPSDTCLRRGFVLVLLNWMGGARSVYRLGQVVANQRVFLQACECLSSFLKHWLALVFCVVFTDTSLPAPPSGWLTNCVLRTRPIRETRSDCKTLLCT